MAGMQGRTVLSREGGNDTYMAYDSRGYLAWVVSPEGSAMLASNTVWNKPAPTDTNTTPSARYCYIYENNGFGWPIWRKQPGRAFEYFGYDSAGRVVRSQDGVLRARGNKWLIYNYDVLGRETCRGVSSEASALEEVVDTVLARTFYGNYSGLGSGLGFQAPDYGTIMISADMSHIRGLKTREMVWVLGGSANDYMERAFYYDSDGRLCQCVEKYPDGDIVRTSLAYDFAGDITARCEEHSCTDGAEHLYYTEYTYDHRGRMTGMTRSFEGEQLAAVSYSYDALGRLSGKNITSDTPSGAKTGTESRGYDIRGWSNGSSAFYCGTQLFGETLRYTSASKPGVAARWNGNISEAAYYSPSSVHTFGYAYDAHNRLSGARHFIGNAMTESNTMTEKDITYDRNGNVTGLERYMVNGMHEELVFTHAGNQITQWADVYSNNNGCYNYDVNGNRIHDGHANLDYSYNILNLPASVTNVMNQSVTYKYLADGTKISALSEEGEGKEYRGTFIYDRHSAEGCDWAELSSIAWEEGRIVVEPGNDVGVDSLVVDSLYVEDFPIEGEEIVVDSTAVVPFYLHDLWYVKDHLGSVRSVVLLGEDYSATAALVEQNDYYPFGTRIAGTAGAASDSLDYANRDRFCGKEEQDFSPSLNLRLLDFSARYYDPFTCRWTTQDPLAEKYYSLSPYNYCANNPVNLVDPEGVAPIYDEYGMFMGTDDEGLQGDYIVMASGFFKQGMTHQDAVNNSFVGPISQDITDLIKSHFSSLPSRPDYDGFVTIEEGIDWAKRHVGAKDNPTPENTLYVNAALLDFGNTRVDFFKQNGDVTSINLFNGINTIESVINPRLRSTVYALGAFNARLLDGKRGVISIESNDSAVYDWNTGGPLGRRVAINLERKRAGVDDSHGFRVCYYGTGYLRNNKIMR